MKSLRFQASVLVFVSNVILSHQTSEETRTVILYKWKIPEFEYTDAAQQEGVIPTNVPIIDSDYYPPSGRFFVTTPKFREGTPATIYEIIGQPGVLRPFPRWPPKTADPDTILCEDPFSVYRIFIDKCGLLWAVDSGKFSFSLRCNPKLLIYDLNNWDREVLRHEFKFGPAPMGPRGDRTIVATDRSSLLNIITESYRNDCSDSVAYIADVNDHALVVFDLPTQSSWRVESHAFYPYPSEFTSNINGVVFEIMAGLLGLALGPATERDRKLYLHSYTSVKESWVSVNVVKNRTAIHDREIIRTSFIDSPGQRAGQSTVEVMTDDGILIYVLLNMNAIACWNSRTPYTIENQHILKRDDVNFQFISGMKLKNNQLLITSSRFQNFNKLNPNEYNYRLMLVEDVDRLLQNTPCRPAYANSYASDNVDSSVYAAPSTWTSPQSSTSRFGGGPYGRAGEDNSIVSRAGQFGSESQRTYVSGQTNNNAFLYGGWFQNYPKGGFTSNLRPNSYT